MSKLHLAGKGILYILGQFVYPTTGIACAPSTPAKAEATAIMTLKIIPQVDDFVFMLL